MHNEELHNFYFSPNIGRAVTSNEVKQLKTGANGEFMWTGRWTFWAHKSNKYTDQL